MEYWDEYENNKTNYYVFNFDLLNGRFWHGGEDSDIGEGGNWKTLSKNKVYFHTSYVMEYEEDSSWELVFKFEKDGSFNLFFRKKYQLLLPRI